MQKKIEAKIAAKKAAQEAKLKDAMQSQLQNNASDTVEHVRDERKKVMWDAEVDAARTQLANNWQGGGDPPIALTKEIAHAVLEQRHDKENLELSTSQMVQRAKAVESSLGPLNATQAEELAAAGSASEQKKLQKQHKDAIEAVRKNIHDQMQAKNGPKNLMLAEQQFQEVMSVVAAVAPAHADGIRAEQRQLEEIGKQSKMRNEKMQQRLDLLLSQQEDASGASEEAMQAEMAQLEQSMDAALRAEQTKVEKEVNALERRKAHAINKVEAEHAAIEAKAGSTKDKLALKDKHKLELDKLRNTLDNEEKRQVDALEANLDAQAEKRRQDKKAALERKHANEAAAQQKALQAQIDRLKAEEASSQANSEQQLREAKSGFEAAEQAKTADELSKLRLAFEEKLVNQAEDPAKREEEQRAMTQNLIQASQPMMKQMAEQSKQAAALSSAVPQIVSESVQSAVKPMNDRLERMEAMLKQANGGEKAANAEVYHDAREQTWQRGASKTVELADTLSPTQAATAEYTGIALDKLQPTGSKNMREVKVAKNLPNSNSSGNAFSQSYHFDEKTGELFVRAERMDSAGEMLVILAHANAHIKSGVMDNDQDPSFQREFYGGLMSLMDAGMQETQQAKKELSEERDTMMSPEEKKAAEKADKIIQEAEEAHREQQKVLQEGAKNQGDKLERRKTEARKKRAEQVKKNVTAKLTGGAEGQPRITAAQARAQQAMVKKLFEAIDTDGDGMLNSTELKALCVGSGVELTQEKHDSFMEQFGKNNEGLVPFEEFFKWYSSSLTGLQGS